MALEFANPLASVPRHEILAIQLLPITDDDVPRAAQFLYRHMNSRISAASWASALTPSWSMDAPNHGFMLLAQNAIVGVQVAFYSQRSFENQVYHFCNLAAWCVLEDYRAHGLRLLKATLSQAGYHFTDFSPSGNVVPLNTRLKFQNLDTTTALVPNVPWSLWSWQTRIISDPERIKSTLKGRDLEIYRDHSGATAAHHLVIIRGDEVCYVIFRKDRRKNLPFFASLLYVGNPCLLDCTARHLLRYLLFRYGILATLAERRVVGYRRRLPLSLTLQSPRPKMYKSDRLNPEHIDYLYSELTCVPW